MRLFNKGDEIIPSIINLKEPILHFATHNLLPRSEILFKVFKDNLKFINIVRHPVYMVHQQAINHIEFTINSSRQFIQTFNYKKKEIPIFWEENPKEYLAIKNPFEKAIYQINKMNSLNKKIEQIIFKNYRKNYLKISFEKFVLNPQSYIQSIEKFLKVKFDKNVFKTMHYEKVPRSKIIDGRDVKIYRKYGWKRGSNKFSEREEINKKIEFFESKDVSQKYLNVLKKISDEYESNFLKGIIN